MEQNDRIFEDFICVCNDDGIIEADALLAEVKDGLNADDATLLTRVVIALNWDYTASIEAIYNDQWSLVVAKTYKKAGDGEPVFTTRIQCDWVEHGIAATWRAFRDRFPDGLRE